MGQTDSTAHPAAAELAQVIWRTSRGDESTISATGANIVAEAVIAAGWSKATAVCALEHGHDGNPARVYGHHGSTRTCIRLKGTDQWVYDPAWESADKPRTPVQPPPPPHIPAGGGSAWVGPRGI